MSGKNINVRDKKILKSGFYKNKKVTNINDIDANKLLVSKEEPYCTKNSFKYFIGYDDNDVIRPLCIKLLQMTGYVTKFEGNTTMFFNISDKQLLKKYNQIWKRVDKLLKIESDSKPVYGDNKYIKNKNTNFQDKKMPKEKAPYNYLSIIMLDSVINAKKKYYPQTLLEECKYKQKKIKIENLIDDDLEKRLSGSEADNDYNDETESDYKSNE